MKLVHVVLVRGCEDWAKQALENVVGDMRDALERLRLFALPGHDVIGISQSASARERW